VTGNEFVKLDDVLASAGPEAFTPDGVRVDRYGNVFVALYRGGGFAVFSSDGKLIRTVELPALHHSNLAATLFRDCGLRHARWGIPRRDFKGAQFNL
jgi:sugar lactone lactonase YvrE